ncbi:MAG: thiol peroxidase [Cocleimonas sp.]
MAQITLRGNAINTNGELPTVGSQAPDFVLTTGDLADVTLADYAGKKKLLNIVPSLDTPTCQLSTKKFNDAAKKHENAVFLTVSADLPFAQGRFCQAENLEAIQSLSTMRSQFSEDYGVKIIDGPLAGVTGRAVLVLDEDNKVIHSELVPEIAQEPDYDSALATL